MWISKRQACIALSSSEAEIMAASAAGVEIIHARGCSDEMGIPQQAPTALGVDNSGAIDIAHDPMHRGRSMHIERRHLKIREFVARGLIKVYKVPTEANLADFLTKALSPSRFATLRGALMHEFEM